LSAMTGLQGMRAVFDDLEAVRPRDAHHRVHVARQPVEMRWDDRTRARRDRALEGFRIYCVCARGDVREDRRETRDSGQFWNYPERQCRKDDLPALRQVERLQQVV